jgi:hypothetical protein
LTFLCCMFLFCPVRIKCLHHPSLFDLIIQTFGEECNLWSFSLCSFLQSFIVSSPLGPNISLSTRFLNSLSLYSFLPVIQLPHMWKITGKIVVL